jgi:large subunit ribosomal protein L33
MASAVREGILLVCSECKNQNYSVDKNKKLHPDRFEIKKYCKHCQKKTVHKEKK